VVTIEQTPEEIKLERRHWNTIVVIGALLVGVLFFEVNVGMGALAGAVALAMFGAADHKEAVKKMPWSVIVMMSGVTVLISLLEKTGGLDLFTAGLAALATPGTITGVIAFVIGLISVYSSTSGVVLPAFLPTVPGLIERLGGARDYFFDPITVIGEVEIKPAFDPLYDVATRFCRHVLRVALERVDACHPAPWQESKEEDR